MPNMVVVLTKKCDENGPFGHKRVFGYLFCPENQEFVGIVGLFMPIMPKTYNYNIVQ